MNRSAFFSKGLYHGFTIGLVSIILFMLMYITNYVPVGIGSGLVTLLVNMLISFALASWLTVSFRKSSMNNVMTYGQAFLYSVFILVTGTIIAQLFTLLFYTVIDPEYMLTTIEKTKAWTENYMVERGIPEAQIQAAMEKMEEQMDKGVAKTILSSSIGNLIIAAVVSLFSAMVAKKEEQIVPEG